MQLDKGNKSIVPFLRKKRILALGCKFDNWYFRFFWYIITRGFGIRDRDGNTNTIDNLAIIFNPNDNSDKKLKDYLSRIDVCLPLSQDDKKNKQPRRFDDVWQFMGYIHNILTSTAEDSPFRKMILSKRREGGIFISYKSCDVLDACSLFCKLAHNNDLNVWFDTVSLNVGNPYKHVIEEAIGKAKIFIPILSPAIAKELEQEGESIATFYSKEWKWAAKNPKLAVFPVAIDGYDFKSSIHKTFVKIVGHEATTGDDMTDKPLPSLTNETVGFPKLLSSIKKEFGIEES